MSPDQDQSLAHLPDEPLAQVATAEDGIERPAGLRDKYRYIRELGSGAQATTVLAERLSDGELVAVKSVHLCNVDDWKQVELFERECQTLAALNINGIPHYYEQVADYDKDMPQLHLVQSYNDSSSTWNMLIKTGKKGI